MIYVVMSVVVWVHSTSKRFGVYVHPLDRFFRLCVDCQYNVELISVVRLRPEIQGATQHSTHTHRKQMFLSKNTLRFVGVTTQKLFLLRSFI